MGVYKAEFHFTTRKRLSGNKLTKKQPFPPEDDDTWFQ